MSWFTGLRDLLRGVDALMQIEQKHGKAIEDVKDRVGKLEVGGSVLIAEAKGAASAAASAAVMQHIADLARRIGALEEFARQQGKSESRRRLTDR